MNWPRYFLVAMGMMLALTSSSPAQVPMGDHEDQASSSTSSVPLDKTSLRIGPKSRETSNSTSHVGWIRAPSDSSRPSAENPWKVRYLVSLLIVGGIMTGGFIGLKRLQSRLPGLGFRGGNVRVVGRVPLDQRTTLFVIRLRDEELVLSSGPSRTNLLSRYPVETEEEGI